MAYILHCREAGFDCNTVVNADSANEILSQIRSHAYSEHDLDVTPGMEDLLRMMIRCA